VPTGAGWTASDRLENYRFAGPLEARLPMLVDERDYQVTLLSEFPLRSSNGALNGSLTRLNQGLDESAEC